MSVEAARVALIVFAMPGCPACHEFLPRITRQIQGFQKLGVPFVFYETGTTIRPGQIPVIVVDSTSTDPSVIALADQHGITALPTTIVLPRYGQPERIEGAVDEQSTYELLMRVYQMN